MKIPDLNKKLNFKFKYKPLLIGGLAMEYYGLRKSGKDIDFVLSKTDHKRLKTKMDKLGMKYLKGRNTSGYKNKPEFIDLYGDQGILIYELEMWNQILRFDYDFLSRDAIEKHKYFIISLEKLLFLKALGIKKEKYLNDTKLIVQKIIDDQYQG